MPGVLGVLLVGALVVLSRTGNRVAPEPAVGEGASPGVTATPPPPVPVPAPSRVPDPPPPERAQAEGAGGTAAADAVEVTPTHPEPTSPDPRGGRFTLAQATAGLPTGTRLVADIETSVGTFVCDLWPDRAPVNVANFVGLARGTRDFWDPVAGRWTRRPFYDGSIFHRVIPGFMIQGGDILRNGRGGSGYEIPDENVASHDQAGLLCMANHGPNTAGAQFFITEGPKEHLNGSYSVLGRCAPTDLVPRIAGVPRDPRDRPLTPVTIRHVRVHR